MISWLILTATLPTAPSGLRVRVWRALKATGAGALREGVYVLPESAATAGQLRALEQTIVEAGAQAYLLVVQARDAEQEAAFKGLFDRTEAYEDLMQSARELQRQRSAMAEASLRRQMRALEQQLHGLQATDFFPGPASGQAGQALAELRRQIELQLSADEPAASLTPIEPRRRADYQGRTWATRQRPWVDRLATAWLVVRFIDDSPRFIWLADAKRCPRAALGFDFDGATFTHVGDKVTFEVMAESFGLLDDPALRRLAAIVHCIDVGGVAVDEAAGLEMLVRGLQARHDNDDELLAAAIPMFDALLAAARHTP